MSKAVKNHIRPLPDVPLSQQKLGRRWTFSSLEYGWLEQYVLNSEPIMSLLQSPRPEKPGPGFSFYQEPATLLLEAYLTDWSFLLPAESDDEFKRRRKEAKKKKHELVQIPAETHDAMQTRLQARPQVCNTLHSFISHRHVSRRSTAYQGMAQKVVDAGLQKARLPADEYSRAEGL